MSRFKRPCYHVIELKTHLVIEKQIKKPLTFLYANLRISSYSSWPMERNRVNAKGCQARCSVCVAVRGCLRLYLLCPTGPMSPCRLMYQLWRCSFQTLHQEQNKSQWLHQHVNICKFLTNTQWQHQNRDRRDGWGYGYGTMNIYPI